MPYLSGGTHDSWILNRQNPDRIEHLGFLGLRHLVALALSSSAVIITT